jgi:hypothetical protein
MLFKIKKDKHILILPTRLKIMVLNTFHDNQGHMGFEKTFDKIKSRYWWKNYRYEIDKYIKECETCQKNNRIMTPKSGYLSPRDVPINPYEVISIDHLGPLPKYKNYTHIVISIDHATRHVVAKPQSTTSSISFIKFLNENILCIYGLPSTIITDRGTGFMSKDTFRYFETKGIKHLTTPPHWPQANGLVERMVGTLTSALRKSLIDKNNWPEILPEIVFSINASKQKSSKFSPFFLLYGYEPKIWLDRHLGVDENANLDRFDQLLESRNIAKQNMLTAKDYQKT